MSKKSRKEKKDSHLIEDQQHALRPEDRKKNPVDDEGLEVEKKDLKSKMSSFQEKVSAFRKEQGHKRMERYVRYMAIAGALIFSGIGISYWHNHQDIIEQASKPTSVGTEVAFSQTGTTLVLGKPKIASDGNTSFVPFTFKDMRDLSINANNYKIFGIAPTGTFKYKPSAQLLLYGDTGRGAIVVHASPKPQSDVIQFIIRNDKKLTDSEGGGGLLSQAMSSDSLSEAGKIYDLLALSVNPFPDNYKPDEKLNGEQIDPIASYRQLFSNEDEKQAKEDIKQQQKQIDIALTRMKEYEDRLERNGYVLPKRPFFVKDNWLPSEAPDIDVNSNLEKGYENTKSPLKKRKGAVKVAESGSQDEDIPYGKYSDEYEYEDNIKRDDGTYSDDEINSVQTIAGSTAQQTWEDLQQIYTSILVAKQQIYVTDANLLLQIERDMERQGQTTSLSDLDKFEAGGTVKY